MSLGRSGPGVRSGFLETPRTRFGGVFLASAQTASQFAAGDSARRHRDSDAGVCAAADSLGERGQIGRGDRPRWDERRRSVARRCGSSRHENTSGHAYVQVHVVAERGAEAVQEGDTAELWAGGSRHVGSRGPACRREQETFDVGQEDLRERRDGSGPVGEHAAQSLRDGNHPLPHGHRRDDVIGEVGGGL